nr:MAG TPA: hypothetical protein [Caudoviricetes sp.]
MTYKVGGNFYNGSEYIKITRMMFNAGEVTIF